MQQLFSVFGIDWHLLLAQAVNFGIVLIALWYFLYKPVLAMLERRRGIVAKGVEDAARAADALSRSDGEALSRITAADEQAEDIISAARESATREKTRLLKEAEARALAVARDAEARANEAAARQRRESEQEIARLAVLAAEKILKKHHD
ncbi:ATP synthase F0 subunit B [Candidatus Kaiserbacteria bacterium]|nr:ATP synthase F0 subunit B [Candidatus Kaiserbacteria bacterium]